MSKWFCKTEDLSPVVKLAAFDAGYLVAKTYPSKVATILPVAEAILEAAKSGNESLNTIFREAIFELVNEQIKDEMVKMNVVAVLSMINFDINVVDTPVLKSSVIEGITESFINGMKAYRS